MMLVWVCTYEVYCTCEYTYLVELIHFTYRIDTLYTCTYIHYTYMCTYINTLVPLHAQSSHTSLPAYLLTRPHIHIYIHTYLIFQPCPPNLQITVSHARNQGSIVHTHVISAHRRGAVHPPNRGSGRDTYIHTRIYPGKREARHDCGALGWWVEGGKWAGWSGGDVR